MEVNKLDFLSVFLFITLLETECSLNKAICHAGSNTWLKVLHFQIDREQAIAVSCAGKNLYHCPAFQGDTFGMQADSPVIMRQTPTQ